MFVRTIEKNPPVPPCGGDSYHSFNVWREYDPPSCFWCAKRVENRSEGIEGKCDPFLLTDGPREEL
jgi:hypothetical protein